MKSEEIIDGLESVFPNPVCELNYNKDYELLIATVLSAQSTDKRVNIVTNKLFSLYDVFSLSQANNKDIENIIYSVGSFRKKAEYIINISKALVKDYNGGVPNDRKYLESLPGVGRKTCNVVLGNLYNEPVIAVDTHVARVANRLKLTNSSDVKIIENDLMNYFPKDKWNKLHLQMVLFGRYICKSKNPLCSNCPFWGKCKKDF